MRLLLIGGTPPSFSSLLSSWSSDSRLGIRDDAEDQVEDKDELRSKLLPDKDELRDIVGVLKPSILVVYAADGGGVGTYSRGCG